jgi:putative transcriptional regulator
MNERRNTTNRKARETKDTSIESEILEALGEFTDALEKEEVAKRFTCRQIKLDLKPTSYGPELVKTTRRLLKVSQTLFARFLGISPKTVRSWEQGINTPSPIACRFMDEIRRSPDYWTERLREAIVTEVG